MSDKENKVPRRCRIDLHSPAENVIYKAILVVEAMEANEKLTEAGELLDQALNRVADYIDEQLGIGMIQ